MIMASSLTPPPPAPPPSGYSSFTGRSEEQIRDDLRRDVYLSATEAVDYGLIDAVMTPKGSSKDTSDEEAKFGSYGSGDEQKFQEVVNTAAAAAAEKGDAPAPATEEPPSALLRLNQA